MPSHGARQFQELLIWLAKKPESARAFALRVGVDKSTFNRLLNGNVTQFDLAMIEKVAAGTEGAIGHEAFAAFGKRLAANPLSKRRRRIA